MKDAYLVGVCIIFMKLMHNLEPHLSVLEMDTKIFSPVYFWISRRIKELKEGTPKMKTQGSQNLSFLVCIFAVPYFSFPSLFSQPLNSRISNLILFELFRKAYRHRGILHQ